ncbi:MAG TPA: pitrilysin family protein [Bryobacteraceae bacterium]|nr:pitrilysin family protein [Bryobacteraceae bacterium]
MATKTLWILAITALGLAAQTVDRTKPPQTPPIPSYKLPPVSETKLPNGLGIVLVDDARFPLVTVRLNFQAGNKFDPPDRPGLADAVASLLNEGTKTRTSRQISEETDAMGGSLSADAGPDSLTISGNAVSESLSRLLTLLADVTMNATFPQDEVDLYKQNRIQNLRAERSEPSFLAREKMSQAVYGSSPYSHIAPTEQAIGKLDAKVLGSFRETFLVPNNATLLVIGRLPARAELLKTVTQLFGSWQQRQLPAPPQMAIPAPHRQIVLVDRPGSVQADIHVGRSAPTRLSPEYFPLAVGNSVLGTGANSRIFRNIREKEGFAYDAHTEYNTKREASDLAAVTQVRNEVIEPALRAVLAELENMASAPVPAAELTNTKNFLSGIYLIRLETQDGLATQLNLIQTLGLPKDYLETYTTRVRSVEPGQIQDVSKKYIAPDQDAIIVVGDASKIGDAVRKFGEVTVVKAE